MVLTASMVSMVHQCVDGRDRDDVMVSMVLMVAMVGAEVAMVGADGRDGDREGDRPKRIPGRASRRRHAHIEGVVH